MKHLSIRERFDEKWTPEPFSGCWLWTGCGDKGGYGQLRIGSKMVKAQRASWMLKNGEIPNGLFVLHRCDVRRCVNPDHLFLGTNADNMQDAIAKGRKTFPIEKTIWPLLRKLPPNVKPNCPKGHAYDAGNIYIYANGKYACKTCVREATRMRRKAGIYK